MESFQEAPSIFRYTDYRKYLRDLFSYKKAKNKYFTYRLFSAKAGFATSSILKEVTEGKKSLTQASILKFASGFGLNKAETEYFKNLVYFNQSKNEQDKNRYYIELCKIQQAKKKKTLTTQQYEYYSHWYNSVIRELVSIKDFRNDPEWIASKLTPAITPAEAQKAVELLIRLGILIKNDDGTLKAESPILDVEPDVTSLSVRNFSRSMIGLGKEAIERWPQDRREVSGLTLGVSRECAAEIKNMVRAFADQVLQFAANDTRPGREVVQLNFQLFPVTKNGEEKRDHA
jgi:uncharacterized protein (TIGR02147 family)